MIDMDLLSVIRRWHFRDHCSIREISRRTGLARNTVRKCQTNAVDRCRGSKPIGARFTFHAAKITEEELGR